MKRRSLSFFLSLLAISAASAQKSIPEAVSQLQDQVAALLKATPSAAPAASGQTNFKNIDFISGAGLFRNASGVQVASFGASSLGSGGTWLANTQAKQVVFAGADTTGSGYLEVSERGGSTMLRLMQNGSDGGGIFRVMRNGAEVGTFGSTTETGGGGAWFANKEGKNVAYIGVSTADTPRLALRNPNGQNIAVVENAHGGGSVSLYSASNELAAFLGVKDNSSDGWLWLKGTNSQDYAEVFDIADSTGFAPGSVVSASPDGSGLVLSDGAYDPKVVGVLSGAGGLHPAMTVGGDQNGSDSPVAIAGQVFVRVCLEGGPIQTGDLLVASSTRGIAMRAADRSKAMGAVLGKALQPFRTEQQGEVRMLVMNH